MNIQIDLIIPVVGIIFQDNDQFFSTTTTIKLSFIVPYEIIAFDLEKIKKLWRIVNDETQSTKNPQKLLSPPENKNETPNKCEIDSSDLVRNACSCIARGNMDLCPNGVGGTYFVRDETNAAVAIFKPTDEEPGAPNNPKHIVEHPILPPGGGAKREVAAYLLGHTLAKVPETRFIETAVTDITGLSIRKSGSIQKFVENVGDATTFGSSNFCAEDVHNIGILDLILLNKDRNGENILVQKICDELHLIPIDHAYVLPNTVDDIWFEWMTWRQAKKNRFHGKLWTILLRLTLRMLLVY